MSINNKQKGSALIFAVIMTGILLAMNFSLIAIFLPKLKSVRLASNTTNAIYAANSALEWCLYEGRVANAAWPVMINGATWRIDSLNTGQNFRSDGSGNSDVCPFDGEFNHRARGGFLGLSRAFELTEL